MSKIDWSIDVRRNPKMFLALIDAVKIQDAKPGKPHTRHFKLAGIKLSYDQVWFTPKGIERHRLTGRDWKVVVSLMPSTVVKFETIRWKNSHWYASEVAIDNLDGLKRDLTLLRMFDVEELF